MNALDQLEIVGRLAMAALLGGIIGLERELRGYPAGIRTYALVTLGAALFTDVSQLLGGDDRVAAGIVTGIGFLGAGVMLREGGTVRGITTAATIWSVAAIGVAIGLELYLLALVATPLVFVILEMRPFSEYISGRRSEPPLPPRLRRAIGNDEPEEHAGDEHD